MYFGTRTDEATSFALLDRYVEAGGRVLDTANCYSFWSSPTGHGGQSEELLGRWLAANPGLRPSSTAVHVSPARARRVGRPHRLDNPVPQRVRITVGRRRRPVFDHSARLTCRRRNRR